MNAEAAMMKRSWNARADKDAFHYIETDRWNGDVAAFFAEGEARAALLIDPMLESVAGRGLALDIGCGVGRMSRALATRFARVIGIDVADEMVARGQALQADRPAITLLAGDGMHYPVESGSVDFAFSYEVFQHMPSHAVIAQNLAEVARVLKPGGTAFIHMKTGYHSARDRLFAGVPAGVRAPIRRLLGGDPLKSDDSYRGARPLAPAEIRARTLRAGFASAAIVPDPTHDGDKRVFVKAVR